jgi:hypothetical protein
MPCSVCRESGHNARTCPHAGGRPESYMPAPGPRVIHCGNCGAEGHNVRSCTRPGGGHYQPPVQRVIHCGNCGEENHNILGCTRPGGGRYQPPREAPRPARREFPQQEEEEEEEAPGEGLAGLIERLNLGPQRGPQRVPRGGEEEAEEAILQSVIQQSMREARNPPPSAARRRTRRRPTCSAPCRSLPGRRSSLVSSSGQTLPALGSWPWQHWRGALLRKGVPQLQLLLLPRQLQGRSSAAAIASRSTWTPLQPLVGIIFVRRA